MVLVEDDVEVETTLSHHIRAGFPTVLVLMPPVFDLPPDLADLVHRIDYDLTAEGAVEAAVNRVIEAARE